MLTSEVSVGLPQAAASLWSLRAQKYMAESLSCESEMVRLMKLVAFWKFKKILIFCCIQLIVRVLMNKENNFPAWWLLVPE